MALFILSILVLLGLGDAGHESFSHVPSRCPTGKFWVGVQLRHSQGAIAGCMDCSVWPVLQSQRATDECAAEPRRLIASVEGDEPPEADDDNVLKDMTLDNRPKAEPTVVRIRASKITSSPKPAEPEPEPESADSVHHKLTRLHTVHTQLRSEPRAEHDKQVRLHPPLTLLAELPRLPNEPPWAEHDKQVRLLPPLTRLAELPRLPNEPPWAEHDKQVRLYPPLAELPRLPNATPWAEYTKQVRLQAQAWHEKHNRHQKTNEDTKASAVGLGIMAGTVNIPRFRSASINFHSCRAAHRLAHKFISPAAEAEARQP
jgi:hypothetical protein